MKRITFAALLAALMAVAAAAQIRPVENEAKPKAALAPESFAAKYEGGMYGYNDKIAGTLKFDDTNERFVFFGEDKKELFGIPYDSLLIVYPQSQAVTSTTGKVVQNIPIMGAALGGFIKEKRRYLILQINDPDIDVKGALNFKIETKELLDSVIQSLADKAGLQQRGDAYFRPKKKSDTN